LENDLKQTQFLHAIDQLRAKGKKGRIDVTASYEYNRHSKLVSVLAEYQFKSWRRVDDIRTRLARQSPLELEVFCPHEVHQGEVVEKI